MNGLMTGRPFTYHVVHRYYGRYLAHLGPSTAPTRSRFPRPWTNRKPANPIARAPNLRPTTQRRDCFDGPGSARPHSPTSHPACLLSLHRSPPPLALQASNGREGDQEDGPGHLM
jgi:hypothetical protein